MIHGPRICAFCRKNWYFCIIPLISVSVVSDIDEEDEAAKELELDGDDVAVIGGAKGDDEEKPGYDGGYSPDEDEDEDAALVADDDDDNVMPPPDDKTDDDDDVEEVEI